MGWVWVGVSAGIVEVGLTVTVQFFYSAKLLIISKSSVEHKSTAECEYLYGPGDNDPDLLGWLSMLLSTAFIKHLFSKEELFAYFTDQTFE